MDVDGYKIVNNYKPPPKRLRSLDLPPVFMLAISTVATVDWGYKDNSLDGECLASWASIKNLALLYNTNQLLLWLLEYWH